MVSSQDSGLSGLGLRWPGSLCKVFGQDTLLSQCLSPPRCTLYKWVPARVMLGVTLR